MNYYYKAVCSRESLKQIREFVKTALQDFSLTEIAINQIILAVDEVCANLIIHANRCNPQAYIEVNIEKQQEEVVFEIVDKGLPFLDYTNYQSPELTNLIQQGKKGGLGLLIVQKIMDHIEFVSKPEENIWRISKKII